MIPGVVIGGRRVGPGAPCLVIAEAGVNHNGDPETALALVRAAAQAGACAVKFQAFRADKLVSAEAPACAYQRRNLGGSPSQRDMLRALELDEAAHAACKALCEELGLLYLCTPFERESADFLESLGVAAYKISSGDLDNHPFLRHVAAKGRPMILSTGMARLGEVEAAVEAARGPGLVLLQCTTEYPADPAQANLRAMATLATAFAVPAGLSDHTPGIEVALAATALGACVIEKHFTLDRSLPGPDHKASLDPEGLRALVRGVRLVEAALGDGVKRPSPQEAATARLVRKSLVAARDIPKGTILTEDMVTAMRPANGLPPGRLCAVIGRAAVRDIARHEPLSLDMLA